MAEDNTTEFMATEPLEPPTIMMTIPSPPSSAPPDHAKLALVEPFALSEPASLAPRPLTPVPEIMEPEPIEPVTLAPATLAPIPAQVPAPATLAPATLAPIPAQVPAPATLAPATLAEPFALAPATLVRQSKVDLLFTALSTNTIILNTVNNIKSRGKLEASDIPILLLGIYNEYQNNNKKVVLTIDDLQILIERVYNYLVDKYTLIDPVNQAVCFLMFTSALKLLLAVPVVKNKKCFFTCFY